METITFNPDDYIPQVNQWFSTDFTYEGEGYAEFTAPKGWIKGYVTVRFDESGESTIEMSIEDFHCEEPLGTDFRWNDLRWLLNGIKPQIEGAFVFHLQPLNPKNTCTTLRITTEHGIFEAVGDIRYNQAFLGDSNHVTFFAVRSTFHLLNAEQAKFFVLPLTNFVSEIAIRYPSLGRHPLDQHPLRIFLTPTVPDELQDEEERGHAFSIANGRNAIIPFKFNNAPGFVERLSDYLERKEQLINGRAQILTTAVLVAEVSGNTASFEHVFDWLPLDFLQLLSLATGSFVGAPWIELRDTHGNLVSRYHTSQWVFPYFIGHEAIDLFAEGGIGWFLTQAPVKLDSALRIAIHLTVKGGNKSLALDDELAYLFRALDTLCEGYGFYPITKPSDFLDQTKLTKLNLGFSQLTKIINELIQEIGQNEEDAVQSNTKLLQRISQQVAAAKSIRPGFGQAVYSLIRDSKFPDVDIVDTFFQTQPREDKRKWSAVLSMYRGIVIHRNYFMLSDGSDDIEDCVRIKRHIHDILLRIILKKLNYDGTYKRVIAIQERVAVDWVRADTPASELGYGVSLR